MNYTKKTKDLFEKKQKEKEQKELKDLLFEAEKENRKKMPKFVRFILSLVMVITLAFCLFLIYDSFNKENMLLQMINAVLVFIMVIIFLIGFKKTYYKRKTSFIIIGFIFLVLIMAFNVLSITKIIKIPVQNTVPVFTNQSLTSALKWAEENNIKTDQTFEFSDTNKKYNIISQDIKPGILTKKINSINFEVSNGPDYNKEVVISDMTGWKIDDAINVIDENFLNNVKVKFEENQTERDIIISQNKSGNIKRNDEIILNVSLGNKENLKPISLKNLKNKSLFKATLYLNRNAINYELKYDFSDKIDKGNVIKQSIKKGTKVSPNDKITLTISKGRKIVVPDFKNKKLSDVTKWIIKNNLKISYSDKYDDNIKNGRIIDTTYKKGEIIEEDTVIGITVSKGKLKMPKFKNLADFKTWADKYQIKYTTKEEFNDNVKKNEIIKFSIKTGETIKKDDEITVYISKGKAIDIPNFIGQDKSSAQSVCHKLNITCSFNLEYNKDKENTVIKQSIKQGEKVTEGTNIIITLATNNKENVTKAKENKENNNKPNNNNTNNNTNNTNNTNNNQNTCNGESYKVTGLTGVLRSCNSYDSCASAIKNHISQYKGVKIIVNNDNGSSGFTSGSYVEGQIREGTTVYCGKTYTITLAK